MTLVLAHLDGWDRAKASVSAMYPALRPYIRTILTRTFALDLGSDWEGQRLEAALRDALERLLRDAELAPMAAALVAYSLTLPDSKHGKAVALLLTLDRPAVLHAVKIELNSFQGQRRARRHPAVGNA